MRLKINEFFFECETSPRKLNDISMSYLDTRVATRPGSGLISTRDAGAATSSRELLLTSGIKLYEVSGLIIEGDDHYSVRKLSF